MRFIFWGSWLVFFLLNVQYSTVLDIPLMWIQPLPSLSRMSKSLFIDWRNGLGRPEKAAEVAGNACEEEDIIK